MYNMFRYVLLLLIGIYTIPLFSQNFTISGYIDDKGSGEKLMGAYIYDIKSGKGTTSNTYGFYSLTLPKDSINLKISYIGYGTRFMDIYLKNNLIQNISLQSSIQLDEVEISGSKGEKIEQKTQMSKIVIPIEQIKSTPALFGEVDVLKILQLLPGVQSGAEGTSGLYIRGGSPDQNLVLLDNVPIYNVSHLLGIFSVFNADALKDVNLIKGGFPARYGGRLSSVIDINMKDGNLKEFHGAGSIGNITSKLMLEGPIVKDRASFLISGRRSYMDLFLKPLIKLTEGGENIGLDLYFYDLNAKLNYRINAKNRLFLSYYGGNDVYGTSYKEENNKFYAGINWGNQIGALRWNFQLSPKLFINTTATLSYFKSNVTTQFSEIQNNEEQNFSAKYLSGINDLGLKIDFDYIPHPNHYIKFGVNTINHTYKPGAIGINASLENVKLDTLIGYATQTPLEYSAFMEDEMAIGKLKINLGLHGSAFDTKKNFYYSVQPRIGINFLINNKLALKASYATMKQYVNLLTSESITTPLDLWVPCTDNIKPQTSWQTALGVATTFNKDIEFSIEGYYKEMKNVLSYLPGSSFFNGDFGETDWESKVTQGKGLAYGMELLLQKKLGKFTGWIGYTLAWNWRQFDQINGGKRYPFKYDRRHDFSIVGTYRVNKKFVISADWVFSTGDAVTLATFIYPEIYEIGTYDYYNEIENIGDKNSFRMSNSHRLDISMEFHKQKKRFERIWVLGAYNVYFHKNPFFIIPENDQFGNTQFKEISLLPLLPFISYQFKF